MIKIAVLGYGTVGSGVVEVITTNQDGEQTITIVPQGPQGEPGVPGAVKFLTVNELPTEDIQTVISAREVFPCFFGSALKMQGVEEFLQGFLNKKLKFPRGLASILSIILFIVFPIFLGLSPNIFCILSLFAITVS